MAHEDFGKKIGGARKDLRGTFRADDIAAMTHIELAKNVRKDMVWPVPDYQKVVQDGMPRDLAATLKMLRDSFPSAPLVEKNATHETLQRASNAYVEVLNAVRAAIDGVKTVEDLSLRLMTSPAIREHIGEIAKKNVHNREYAAVTESPKLLAWRSTAMAASYDDIRSITNAFSYAAMKRLDRPTTRMLDKNPDWPEGTSRVESTIRKERVSMVRQADGTWAVALYETIVPERNFDYYRRRTPFGDVMGKSYPDKAVADAALRKAIEDSFAKVRSKAEEKRKALLGDRSATAKTETYRMGPDFRHNAAIVGQDYLDEFNLSGGEFGNWVSEVERQQLLDRGYDAFRDFGRMIEVEPDQISMGGRLSIAFGARGNGGRAAAAAHYESGRRVINLTKPHGEGTLAHEMAHAFDHYWGDRAREIGLKVPVEEGVAYLSRADLSSNSSTAVKNENRDEADSLIALNKVMQRIFARPMTQAQALATEQANFSYLAERLTHLQTIIGPRFRHVLEKKGMSPAEIDATIADCSSKLAALATPEAVKDAKAVTRFEQHFESVFGVGDTTTIMENSVRHYSSKLLVSALALESISSRSWVAPIRPVATEFAKASTHLDTELGKTTPYYGTRIEMFARAVEATMYDRLETREEASPFLVMSPFGQAYPTGDERKSIGEELLPALVAAARFLPRAPAPKKRLAAESKTAEEAPEKESAPSLSEEAQVEFQRKRTIALSGNSQPGDVKAAIDAMKLRHPGVFLASMENGWLNFAGDDETTSKVVEVLKTIGLSVGSSDGKHAVYLPDPPFVMSLLKTKGLEPIALPSRNRFLSIADWTPDSPKPMTPEVVMSSPSIQMGRQMTMSL